MGLKSEEVSSVGDNIVAPSQSIISKYSIDKILPTTKVIILPTDFDPRNAGQCVAYVKYITGVDLSGNAIIWKNYINTDKPEIGTVVVIQAGRWGHVSLVKEIGEGYLIMRSRNWRGLWIISDDKINLNDPRILGYIRY